MKTLEARVSRGRMSVHVTQFVTSPHVTILLVTRVRRAVVLFRALRRCQIIPAGLCHVHAGYARTCRTRWLAIRCPSRLTRGTAQMQFQRFRRAAAKSRCNVTKMCAGRPFGSRRVLTAFPFRGTSLFQTQIHIVREHAG